MIHASRRLNHQLPHPPPADARLLTKVSWCEKHVFGVVYRDKHLTERLNILNDDLKYDPAKGHGFDG